MRPDDLNKLAAKLPLSKSTLARNEMLETMAPAPMSAALGATLKVRDTTDVEALNQLEKRYLAWLRVLGDAWIGVQCITLKIAHDCRLTMDFAAIDGSGLRLIDTKACHKTKGKLEPHIEEDAMIKMRCAARLFPFIRFLIAWEVGGIWHHKEIKP